MAGSFSFSREFREWRRFKALPRADRRIAFYAEDHTSRVHLEAIVRHLTEDHRQAVLYLSSGGPDSVPDSSALVRPFFIGDGIVRTIVFRTLDVDVMVMTMPGLETFHIKRSALPVHYVYVHHSMVSSHMIYRKTAFDHFDTIFCVGPHHLTETRETEAIYDLPAKRLVRHGYGRLDAIMETARRKGPLPVAPGAPAQILVAPSWGPNCLFETCGEDLVQVLLAAGYRVTARPHPHTRRTAPRRLWSLHQRFRTHPRFAYEDDIAGQDTLESAHLMISDWSGAALDFAFGHERPVLFIDLPRKVNNPEYERLKTPPIEAAIRFEVGAVLPPERLSEAAGEVERLIANAADFTRSIRAARDRVVFNPGRSGEVGAEAIVEILRSTAGPGGNA